MKLDRGQLVDVIERAAFTYVQSVIGLVLASGLTDMGGLSTHSRNSVVAVTQTPRATAI